MLFLSLTTFNIKSNIYKNLLILERRQVNMPPKTDTKCPGNTKQVTYTSVKQSQNQDQKLVQTEGSKQTKNSKQVPAISQSQGENPKSNQPGKYSLSQAKVQSQNEQQSDSHTVQQKQDALTPILTRAMPEKKNYEPSQEQPPKSESKSQSNDQITQFGQNGTRRTTTQDSQQNQELKQYLDHQQEYQRQLIQELKQNLEHQQEIKYKDLKAEMQKQVEQIQQSLKQPLDQIFGQLQSLSQAKDRRSESEKLSEQRWNQIQEDLKILNKSQSQWDFNFNELKQVIKERLAMSANSQLIPMKQDQKILQLESDLKGLQKATESKHGKQEQILVQNQKQNDATIKPMIEEQLKPEQQNKFPSTTNQMVQEKSYNNNLNKSTAFQQRSMAQIDIDVTNLYKESIGQRVIPKEYEAFVGNIENEDELKQEYGIQVTQYLKGFQRIRGDGNCFYTSFIYEYLKIILQRDQSWFDQLMKQVMEVSFQINYKQVRKISNEQGVKQKFIEECTRIRNDQNPLKALLRSISDKNQTFYGLAVIFARNLAYSLFKNDDEARSLAEAMAQDVPSELLEWECECNSNELILNLLSKKLNLHIKIYQSDNEGKLNIMEYGEQQDPEILLIFKPGHYQIGIKK